MIAEHDRAQADTDADATMEDLIGERDGADGADEASSKGKGSKWNAVQHGLMAKELFPEPLASEVRHWTAILADRFRPATPYEWAQITIMGRSGAQLERLRKLRLVDMQRAMDRAELCWDSVQCMLIDKISSRIAKEPARISRALARTKQGAEWLQRSWLGLRAALAVNGEWDEEQCSLARDLLAIRLELRHAGEAIATGTDAAALAALCQREVDRLQELLENSLLALDDGARAMAMAGMPGEEDPDSKKHRKYENSARREYEQAQADLLASQAYRASGIADPTPAPAAAAPAEMGPDSDFEPETETSELEMLRSKLDTVLPETESAPEERPADSTPIRSVEVKPAVEPVSLPDFAAVMPQTVSVASYASLAAAAKPRGNRRFRRAQENKARKAAFRKGA